MNDFFEAHFDGNSFLTFENWENLYSKYLGTLEPEDKQTKKHWLREDTWQLIKQRADEGWWWTECEKKWWDWEIRRKARADKKNWLLSQVEEEMLPDEKWKGLGTLRSEYKPNVYARRDKDGRTTKLNDRAEAMAAYLEVVHALGGR